MAVPYVFANATSAIPLSNLDNNFSTPVTIGNVAIQLGNTATTLSNLSLANVTITSSSISNVTVGSTANAVVYANTTNALVTNSNLTFNGTTFTTANDASIHGITVGLGAGSVSTNTIVGAGAFTSNSTGANNVVVGRFAGVTNTGSTNTFVGDSSGYWNSTGSNNVGVGFSAYAANTTTATGSNNTALGVQSLYNNTTASYNTAVGYQAGYLVTGAANVCVGASSGSVLTTGANNIHIGNTSSSSTGAGQEIVLGATSGASVVGKGTNTGFIYAGAGGVYQGNNSAAWSITSDQRLKKNIVDNTVGLNAINQIQVRNFEYRLPEEVTELEPQNAIAITGVQLGAIAQELQEILPDCVKTESTGVMSVDTTNLTWHMVNAVKELSALVTAQSATIQSLTDRITALENK